MTRLTDPKAIIDALDGMYCEAVDALKAALHDFLHSGKVPSQTDREAGLFAYPELVIRYGSKFT